MSKSRKQKRIFKNPPTKTELEGAAALGLSRKMQPHQRVEFMKAAIVGVDESEGDLSYAQLLGKKAQGFLTSEDKKLSRKMTDKLMDLVEDAKLRYGREMITAVEAVTFIEDELLRELARKQLLVLLIDTLIDLTTESGYFTNEQHEEIRAFFRGMVELSIFYHDLDDIENIEQQPLIIGGRVPDEKRTSELFDFTYESLARYTKEKITAEEATKSADDWKHAPAKYLLLSRVICILYEAMTDKPDAITREQYDEIKDYIGHLTFSYIAYTTRQQEEEAHLKAKDVWDAYPVFAQERYGDNQPCMASQIEEVSKEFYDWLVNNPDYDFDAVAGQPDAEKWLHGVVELCVGRRIMQYKYILYEYHGKDTFADPEVRDQAVAYARAHPESIGQ